MPDAPLPPIACAQVAAAADGAVRVAPLLGLIPLLGEYGLDPAQVIAEAGLDPRLFDDPENCISFATGAQLLARCAEVTGCAHFGLRVGERAGIEVLGLVGVLVAHSPTIDSALRNLVLHLHLHDRGAVPTLSVEGTRALLGYAVYVPGVEASRQVYDVAIAVACNIMRALAGPGWRPVEVLFSHSRPADPAPFQRFFQAPVRFNFERSALVFDSAWLRRPLPGADADLRRLLEARIAAMESLGAGNFVEQVRRVLRNLLLGGRGSLEQVSAVFSVHRRTVNRRLRERGTSFRHLIEEARRDIATQLLRETDLPVVAIAAVLDYADVAAFTRAFRRWTNDTPAAWRRARAGD